MGGLIGIEEHSFSGPKTPGPSTLRKAKSRTGIFSLQEDFWSYLRAFQHSFKNIFMVFHWIRPNLSFRRSLLGGVADTLDTADSDTSGRDTVSSQFCFISVTWSDHVFPFPDQIHSNRPLGSIGKSFWIDLKWPVNILNDFFLSHFHILWQFCVTTCHFPSFVTFYHVPKL